MISSDQSVYVRAVEVALYGVCMGTHDNAVMAPVFVHKRDSKTEEKALIDSGATENFLDYRTAKRLDLGPRSWRHPDPS